MDLPIGFGGRRLGGLRRWRPNECDDDEGDGDDDEDEDGEEEDDDDDDDDGDDDDEDDDNNDGLILLNRVLQLGDLVLGTNNFGVTDNLIIICSAVGGAWNSPSQPPLCTDSESRYLSTELHVSLRRRRRRRRR